MRRISVASPAQAMRVPASALIRLGEGCGRRHRAPGVECGTTNVAPKWFGSIMQACSGFMRPAFRLDRVDCNVAA
jgi:hypothetical protein